MIEALLITTIAFLAISIRISFWLWREKEDYRLWFEASKEYETYQYEGQYIFANESKTPFNTTRYSVFPPKLNKDGSIAKKRGRKPRHEN